MKAHLQLNNQQQVLFLWLLVYLNVRRREGLEFEKGRKGVVKFLPTFIEGLLCARTLC